MNGLIIKEEPLDKILNGRKRWEIRGSRTKIRGAIGLIESGSKTVVGTADLVECIGPLTASQYGANARKIGIRESEARRPYKKTFAWVFKRIRVLKKPVPYPHRSGAMIWVRLDDRVRRRITQ